ncbi:MAG: hypothetical protein HC820_05570 [Hydrococcus sp. RM1_1_31]|nr:hypothetical protein [Hydrococcus sp. RM1_1_31]
MPRPRKYKDSGERREAFLENHPDYDKSDRLREIKREWAKRNRPECPRCSQCDARLKGEKSRALGLCRNCQRKPKQKIV